MTIRNLSGSLTIYDFKIQLSTPYFEGPYVVIPYKGISNPTLTNVSLSNYQYSINGIDWEVLTPTNDTLLNNLTFIPTGNSFYFKWILTNRNIFNKDIFIRMRAVHGDVYTAWATISVYFKKIIENKEFQKGITDLPEDYKGVEGSELLKNAPKIIIE